MKNLIPVLITLILAFTACNTYYEPDADFKVSNTTVGTNEDVYFYNYSHHANSYEWDFDDGTISTEFEPVHYFTEPGIYKVRLSAFHDELVSDMYVTIEVIDPDLDIQVREFFDKYVVPNAKVILYPTLADWDAQTNAVTSGITDNDGIVRFYNLPKGFYFMDISNTNHNNYTLADDDIGFIQTPYIGVTTTIMTAYVDYTGTKSAKINRKITPGATTRPFDVKMRERITK